MLLMSTECAVGRLAVDRDALVRRKVCSGKRINQPKVETIGLVNIIKFEYSSMNNMDSSWHRLRLVSPLHVF